jgi:hypothetical protein
MVLQIRYFKNQMKQNIESVNLVYKMVKIVQILLDYK